MSLIGEVGELLARIEIIPCHPSCTPRHRRKARCERRSMVGHLKIFQRPSLVQSCVTDAWSRDVSLKINVEGVGFNQSSHHIMSAVVLSGNSIYWRQSLTLGKDAASMGTCWYEASPWFSEGASQTWDLPSHYRGRPVTDFQPPLALVLLANSDFMAWFHAMLK